MPLWNDTNATNANDQAVVEVGVALPSGTNSIGQVTANAGTNLNTSALALESTQSTQNTRIGDLTETAPANDTASSGLNGRLQRIAQRLTSLIALIPTSLGQKTMANSLAVVVSSDQSALTVQFSEPQTYSASSGGFTMASRPTDVFAITGSSSKTIKIHKIKLTGTTTSGSPIKTRISGIKRSTANTGGTFVSANKVPHDSNNAAATATVGHYTANPTLGTAVGTVRAESLGITNSGISGGSVEWIFNTEYYQPLLLRGISEQLTINLNGTTVTGSVMSISIEWSEV